MKKLKKKKDHGTFIDNSRMKKIWITSLIVILSLIAYDVIFYNG